MKIISFLLTWLPESYEYRVLFMERNLDEVVASQDAMLGRQRDRAQEDVGLDAEGTIRIYSEHLTQVSRFLAKRSCFTTLRMSYDRVLAQPQDAATRVAEFLGGQLDVAAMAAAVDPALRRKRRETLR